MKKKIYNVGIAGWGLAGKNFHAPFVWQEPRLSLTHVVTSRDVDGSAFPGVKRVNTLEDLLAADVDLVVLATPDALHVEGAKKVLGAGKSVVVEKPLAKTVQNVRELQTLADQSTGVLIPFQNRRWDGDFKTVRSLLAENRLGQLHYYESNWPKYRPVPKLRTAWKASDLSFGLLYDLGAHLIDHTIVLFGAPETVWAKVRGNRSGASLPDWVVIRLTYPNGLIAQLEIDQLNPFERPRFHLRGNAGSFEMYGLDPQEERLIAGNQPSTDHWGGYESERFGTLITPPTTTTRIPTINGDYRAFWRGVVTALDGGVSPVPLDDVILQMRIFESIQHSNEKSEAVKLV